MEAQVSAMTVSRVLRDDPRGAPATAPRVRAAVGREAGRLLMARMRAPGAAPHRTVIPTTLVHYGPPTP
ncbi:LacI family DNA-binding transcriptional regulator [Streptomyces sp. NPDC004610]|uniref:LacI family DNA-binding transcriptional regulator n=1 Tax=Streptomyces sp. NPDC004610 TaxID=3154668 RepID=UPI0033A320F2